MNTEENTEIEISNYCTEYKIGDKVIVTLEPGIIKQYGNLFCVKEMLMYNGLEAKITSFSETGKYYIDVDSEYWMWNDLMLTSATVYETADDSEIDELMR